MAYQNNFGKNHSNNHRKVLKGGLKYDSYYIANVAVDAFIGTYANPEKFYTRQSIVEVKDIQRVLPDLDAKLITSLRKWGSFSALWEVMENEEGEWVSSSEALGVIYHFGFVHAQVRDQVSDTDLGIALMMTTQVIGDQLESGRGLLGEVDPFQAYTKLSNLIMRERNASPHSQKDFLSPYLPEGDEGKLIDVCPIQGARISQNRWVFNVKGAQVGHLQFRMEDYNRGNGKNKGGGFSGNSSSNNSNNSDNSDTF